MEVVKDIKNVDVEKNIKTMNALWYVNYPIFDEVINNYNKIL